MGQLKRQLVIWSAIAATTAVLPGLALADNASPDHGGGRHGRGHQQGEAKEGVAGRALGKADKDSYGIEIRGRSGEKPTDAGGMVRFAHRGEKVSEGLVGEITCLSKDEAGIVSVTGTIKRSGSRASKGDKKMMPGTGTAALSDDDGTALLDELAPLDADESADLAADDPTLPGAPTAPSMPGQDPDKKKPGEGHDHNQHRGELAGKDFAFTIDVPGKPQHFSQPTVGEKGSLAACSGGGAPVEVTRGGFRATAADGHTDGDRRHHRFGGHRRGGDK